VGPQSYSHRAPSDRTTALGKQQYCSQQIFELLYTLTKPLVLIDDRFYVTEDDLGHGDVSIFLPQPNDNVCRTSSLRDSLAHVPM
jgi:hypothetical protein